MKTIKFENLESLMQGKDLHFDDFVKGEIYHRELREWVHFDLPEEELLRAARLYASALCTWSKTIRKYTQIIYYYNGKSYGIFERLWIKECVVDGKSTLQAVYCAGQDGSGEVALIKKLLAN